MEWMKSRWSNLLLIVAVVSAVFTFLSMMAVDAETQKKLVTYDSTFQAVQKIAVALQDPNIWLKNYLLNHGVDTIQASIWSRMQKGAIPDSLGKPIESIPFLSREYLPERGVLQVYVGDSVFTMKTLWDFPKKKKE